MAETEKIIEISLAKIENSKIKKGTGKLHKNLLVNSLLNRVRVSETEKTKKEPLMNYRESKLLVDLDIDDYDMDKIPTSHERTYYQQRYNTQATIRKQSSLVTKLNTRSIGKTDMFPKTLVSMDTNYDLTQNIQGKLKSCDCPGVPQNCITCTGSPKQAKKRIHSIELLDEDCPRKKLRCLWTPNINTKHTDVSSFSVSSLSSLFGNLVAHSDSEKSLDLKSKFVSAMVAC